MKGLVIPVSGTRLASLAALMVACLVAVTAAQAGTGLKVKMTKGYNWAQFVFSTPTPTRATVSVSAGNGNCAMSTKDGARKKVHRILVPGLQPGTKYFYCAKAVMSSGKTVPARGSFVTPPPGPSDLRVRGGKLVLKSGPNYYPFTPIMSEGYNCYPADSVALLYKLGVNLLVDAGKCASDASGAVEYMHSILRNRTWLVTTNANLQAALEGLPELLLRDPAPANFLMKGVPYVYSTGIGSCNPENDKNILSVAFKHLKNQAAAGPVIYEDDISTPWANGRQNCYDAPSMAAQLFMAMIAEVQGYRLDSNHVQGVTVQTQVKDGLMDSVKEFSQLIATYGPALRSGKTVTSESNNPDVQVLAKQYGGYTYLFALNTSRSTASSVQITFAHATSTAQNIYPSVSLASLNAAGLNISLGPLQRRVYRVGPK